MSKVTDQYEIYSLPLSVLFIAMDCDNNRS